MDNKQRIHKRRENETPEQRELRLSHDCLNKKRKRELETDEQREIRLAKDRESKRRKRSILMPIDEHQNRQEEIESNIQQLTESDRILLQDFRSEMNKLGHKSCPVCNERFLSIDIVKEMCRRCYKDNKNNIKKFSSRNNMDPGDVPEELKGLTETEEMLIARVFPVVSVYYLRGGQYGYRGNVINFPQDVQEFITRLPRHPSSLDMLVVRRQSSGGSTFVDFNVRRTKV